MLLCCLSHLNSTLPYFKPSRHTRAFSAMGDKPEPSHRTWIHNVHLCSMPFGSMQIGYLADLSGNPCRNGDEYYNLSVFSLLSTHSL